MQCSSLTLGPVADLADFYGQPMPGDLLQQIQNFIWCHYKIPYLKSKLKSCGVVNVLHDKMMWASC